MLVPVQAEYYALEGLSQLMQSIDLIRRRLNPSLGIGGVLLTMVDSRTRLAQDVEAEVRKHFGALVFRTSVPALGAARRGTEPRPARDRLRPPLGRSRRVLEGGDGACRARLPAARPRPRSRSARRRREPAPIELLELPVDAIHPNPKQPRKRFDGEAGSGLAESVRRQGVIQPLARPPARRPAATRSSPASVAGALHARPGRATVPAVVRDADDRDTLLLGLIENVAREQLTPVEEARAYAVLLDEFGLALGEVAERVGRSKPSVSNRIRLLDLPDDVLGMLERGQLTEGHARAVLAVPDHEGRRRLAREIVQKGLSVRAAEQRAKWAGAKQKPRRVRRRSIPRSRRA